MNIHLISRYSGADPELAPWHQLGGDTWQKAKRKAAEQIRDVAAELLEIYAKREGQAGDPNAGLAPRDTAIRRAVCRVRQERD